MDHNNIKRDFCKCCGSLLGLPKLPVCGDLKDIYHLGAGFPLYWELMKNAGVLILIMLIFSGLYDFYTNWINDDCEGSGIKFDEDDAYYCQLNYVSQLSQVNKRFQPEEIRVAQHLHIATTILMIIAIYIFEKRADNIADDVDQAQHTPADYTVRFTNVPKQLSNDEIKAFIEGDFWPHHSKLEVERVVRAYDIQEYVANKRKSTVLLRDIAKTDAPEKKAKLQTQLDKINEKLSEIEGDGELRLHETPYVFVTFKREQDARDVAKFSKVGRFSRILCRIGLDFVLIHRKKIAGKVLFGDRAPEPSDIIWENAGGSTAQKVKRRIISEIAAFFVLAVCFGLIILISISKKSIVESSTNAVGAQILGVLVGFLISFINTCLSISTRRFANFELHTTRTNYFVSVAKNLSIATFLNSAIVILVTSVILETYWKKSGLLDQVFIVFICNAILPSISTLLDPWHLIRKFRRNKYEKQGESCTLTQLEANELFEETNFDAAQKYSNITKTLLMTAFYACLFPLALPISLIGVFISYWTDKYLLLRRHKKPQELSSDICEEMFETIELVPFVYALGNVIFMKLTTEGGVDSNFDTESVASLIISAIAYLFPITSMLECCQKKRENYRNTATYDEQRKFFNDDYEISNPITREKGLQNWVNYLEEKDKQKAAELKALYDKEMKNNKKGGVFGNLNNYAMNSPGIPRQGGMMVMIGPPRYGQNYPGINNNNNTRYMMGGNMNYGGFNLYGNPYRQQPRMIISQPNSNIVTIPQQQPNFGFPVQVSTTNMQQSQPGSRSVLFQAQQKLQNRPNNQPNNQPNPQPNIQTNMIPQSQMQPYVVPQQQTVFQPVYQNQQISMQQSVNKFQQPNPFQQNQPTMSQMVMGGPVRQGFQQPQAQFQYNQNNQNMNLNFGTRFN